MNSKERRELISKSPISFNYLKRFNTYAGFLHLVQGGAMLVLGLKLAWSRDVYTVYGKITGTSQSFTLTPNPQVFFTASNLGAILASFLLISAVAHFTIAFLKNKKYNENLAKGMNPYRWYEYAFSSSIMIALIALFLGVWDFWSLAMIFTLNAMTMMFGYLMERINQWTEKTDWSAFIIGCISGAIPWLVLIANFIGLATSTDLPTPTFVYLIVVIYFVLFNSFAVNMILQYKGVGRWKDYLYGERVYIVLSLVAKSVLAWIVFVGVFAPF